MVCLKYHNTMVKGGTKMEMSKKLLLEAQFHGSKRLAERKYRVCWGVALVLLCWAVGSITTITINRFLQTPTFLIKLDNEEFLNKFPSVTICPAITFPDYKIEAFLESIAYPPKLSASQLRPIIRQLAAFYSPDAIYSVRSLQVIEHVLEYNNIDIATAGMRLTSNCEETLLRCSLFGYMKNCSELFEMGLTKFGFCCIFNGRSVKNRAVGSRITELPPHMRRGQLHAFNIVINASQDQTDIDLTYNWMHLEASQAYIECGANGTPIAANTETWVGYMNTQFLIDDAIRKVGSQLHVCRPSNDRLKYIPEYSRSHCLLECEIELTLKNCNCSRLTHPRPPNVSYCHATSLECAKESAVWYGSEECDCPSTCDLSHGSFVSDTVPLMPGNYVTDHLYDNLDLSKVSVLRTFIFYRANKVLSRRAYFLAEHLFSQIGGVINVFFGCSILTVLEILQLIWYHFKAYKRTRTLNLNEKLKLHSLNKKRKKKTKSRAAVKTVIDKGKKVKLKRW